MTLRKLGFLLALVGGFGFIITQVVQPVVVYGNGARPQDVATMLVLTAALSMVLGVIVGVVSTVSYFARTSSQEPRQTAQRPEVHYHDNRQLHVTPQQGPTITVKPPRALAGREVKR